MKITDLKLMDPVYIPVVRPGADATVDSPAVNTLTFLQVFTDEGLTGIGEASILSARALNKVLIEDVLKPYVIGEDPLNSERIWIRCTGVACDTAEEARR